MQRASTGPGQLTLLAREPLECRDDAAARLGVAERQLSAQQEEIDRLKAELESKTALLLRHAGVPLVRDKAARWENKVALGHDPAERKSFPQGLGPFAARPLGDRPLVAPDGWTLSHAPAEFLPLLEYYSTNPAARRTLPLRGRLKAAQQQLAGTPKAARDPPAHITPQAITALSGQCTNAAPISVTGAVRRRLSVPETAVYYRWCYPSVEVRLAPAHVLKQLNVASPEVSWVVFGGFAYLDAHGLCIAANAIAGHGAVLCFDGPYQWEEEDEEAMTRATEADEEGQVKGWHRVTLSALLKAGAKYYRWMEAGTRTAKFPDGLEHGGFAYLFREPHAPRSEADRYFPVSGAAPPSTTAAGTKWDVGSWTVLAKTFVPTQNKERGRAAMRHMWGMMAQSLQERQAFNRWMIVDPEDMRRHAADFREMWRAKHRICSLYCELLENLVSPPEMTPQSKLRALCNAADQSGTGLELLHTSTGSEMLCLSIYTQEGPDTDNLMGFKDTPPLGSASDPQHKEDWKKYKKKHQARRRRNPRVGDATPGWALGSVYSVSNWAARKTWGEAARAGQAELEAAKEELTRWTKWLGVLCSAAIPFRRWLDKIEMSLRLLAAALQQQGRPEQAEQVLQQIKVATAAVEQGEVWRGMADVSDQDFAQAQQFAEGDCIGWLTPSSTTFCRNVAEKFAKRCPANQEDLSGPVNSVLFHMHGVTHGIPVWYLSAYPAELELLLPPFNCFRVRSKPSPPETIGKARAITIELDFEGWSFDCAESAELFESVQKDLGHCDTMLHVQRNAETISARMALVAGIATRRACFRALEGYRYMRQRNRDVLMQLVGVVSVPYPRLIRFAYDKWQKWTLVRLARTSKQIRRQSRTPDSFLSAAEHLPA